MHPFAVRPDRLQVFRPATGSFHLLGDPDLVNLVDLASLARLPGLIALPGVQPAGGYAGYHRLAGTLAELPALARALPADAHVLLLTRARPAPHPAADRPAIDLTALAGAGRKIAILPVGPTGLAHLDRFLAALEAADPGAQESAAEPLRQALDRGEKIEIRDDQTSSTATVDLSADGLRWRADLGLIVPGGAQLAPPGALRLRRDALAMPVTGQLALSGFPAVVGGAPGTADQCYQDLLTLAQAPVVVTVDRGVVVDEVVRAEDPRCAPAADALNQLFHADSGYRVLTMLGFGLHTTMSRPMVNSELNLAYGGRQGTTWVTLGGAGRTPLAVSVVCTRSRVVGEHGVLLGRDPAARTARRLHRVTASSCGCVEG